MGQKAALERLWKDRCKVIVRQGVRDPVTKITSFIEEVLVDNQPCKLSFERLTSTNGEPVAAVTQAVKLFLSQEVSIPPGSKISVTRGDLVTDYTQSGQPGVFTHHQEIQLELFKRWA